MLTAHATGLGGCLELRLNPFRDARGLFLKTYHEAAFRELGLCTDWKEEFVTTSARGVLRGMHFQIPPHHHHKLVFCLAGRVLDVVLDLRAGSPTFGQSTGVELSPELANGMYVPAGFAHGFLALEEGSTMLYKVSSLHAPDHDRGLRWNSFGFPWPVPSPLLSARDAGFGSFADFFTPFGA
jgi:dTDP-4-dehydrorhamnose 3,5-epimerase